jgi:hypothetical protein
MIATALVREPRRVDWLTIFNERCEVRALLVAAGEMSLTEAVDGLQESAVETGLVEALGQDAMQAIMARHFSGAP